MLEGLLARDLILAGTTATELLGEGDVLQPWLPPREDGLVPLPRAMARARARCGWRFSTTPSPARSANWPQVMGALLERAVRRVQRMSIHQALLQLSPVETRLLVLFWHLAERWGHVTPDGITRPAARSRTRCSASWWAASAPRSRPRCATSTRAA